MKIIFGFLRMWKEFLIPLIYLCHEKYINRTVVDNIYKLRTIPTNCSTDIGCDIDLCVAEDFAR